MRKPQKGKSLAEVNPELAKEWHPSKNGYLTAYDVTAGTEKKVWWKCNKGIDHEWEASIYNRSKGSGCAVCSGHKAVLSNCLATLNPTLAEEWHPTKNGDLTPNDVTSSSNKKVWWKCDKGDDHEWQSSIANRTNERGCPICSSHKTVLSNCLATLNPDLAKEWHPTKNGELTPFDFSLSSHKKVWWQCDKGDDHIWTARISSRNSGLGCSICSGQKTVLSNCLATLKPDLAKEWHPTKNGELTPFDFTLGSKKIVWWQCDKGQDHEWETSISHRSLNNSNCPFCTLTPQSKQELTITFELIQFFEINPKGFKTRVQGKLWSIDIYIPELELGIEFDGSYWHKDKRALDKLKTEKLEEDGFNIMRIREEPLKAITDIDVISKTPFNAKAVTNDILKHILEAYSVDAKRTKRIEKYLLKEEIQNEKGLDAYIDRILTEKAEKNIY